MDDARFDIITQRLTRLLSRRRGLGLLALTAVLGHGFPGVAEAKKKKRKKKKKCKAPRVKCGKACCADGQDCLNGQCAAPPPPPVPPPGPNPGCPGPADIGSGGNRRFAQSFIAERTGLLTAARCQISGLPPDRDFTLEIRPLDSAGVPTGTILASDTISDVPPVANDQTLLLTGVFDPPASIQTGVGYALVVTVSETPYTLKVRTGDACPGQQLFADPTASGNFIPINPDMVFSATIIV